MVAQVSKGFLIYAQNTDSVDYVKQAYALALSINYSQKNIKSVSLITNDPVPKKYQKIFDQIIPIPWFTDDPTSTLKGENRWKIFHVSPYDETIMLDSDMLILEDISEWWDYCKNYDIKFCSKVKNYKLDVVNDIYHRKAFVANHLTSPYYALHYFKKSEAAYEFYKVLEFVCNNWAWCYEKFAPEHYQNWLSMDLASAIAIEITGMHNYAVDICSPLEFIHMKVPLQEWKDSTENWQDMVHSILNSNGELVVGNIKQTRIFHYVEKQFITKHMLDKLEKLINGS